MQKWLKSGIIKSLQQQNPNHTCFQCGSDLLLVSKITESLPGSLFPQTTSMFRCVNKECQDEKDKQAAKNLKMLQDKEIAIKEKLKEKLQERNLLARAMMGKK
jgi:hypothetical protein